MKRYEYRILLINYKKSDPEDVLNKWGANGWEVTSAWPHRQKNKAGDDYNYYVRAILKRRCTRIPEIVT